MSNWCYLYNQLKWLITYIYVSGSEIYLATQRKCNNIEGLKLDSMKNYVLIKQLKDWRKKIYIYTQITKYKLRTFYLQLRIQYSAHLKIGKIQENIKRTDIVVSF